MTCSLTTAIPAKRQTRKTYLRLPNSSTKETPRLLINSWKTRIWFPIIFRKMIRRAYYHTKILGNMLDLVLLYQKYPCLRVIYCSCNSKKWRSPKKKNLCRRNWGEISSQRWPRNTLVFKNSTTSLLVRDQSELIMRQLQWMTIGLLMNRRIVCALRAKGKNIKAEMHESWVPTKTKS